MGATQFLVYLNRFNEVKPLEVEVIEQGDEYIDAKDLREEKVKTLKVSGVLSNHSSFDEAGAEASSQQSNYEIIPRNKTGKVFANPDKKFEVCFTGFSKAEKQELIQLAKDKDIFVRTDVSTNLGLLVCGANAGWSKLKKANKMGVPRVVGLEGFNNFLETGEFVE